VSGVDLSRQAAGPVTGSGTWSTLRRRLGALGVACLVVIGALGLVALLAPVLPLADPGDVDLPNAFAPPGYDHPLGTDAGGRDILARLVWGSRAALLGPLLVTVAATAAGVVLAVLAAWRRGLVDSVISRGFDVTFAFPGILLALVVAAVTGAGFAAAVTALSLAYVPYVGRVTRGAALRQLRLPYVAALVVQGQSPVAICARHLLPNLATLILAQTTVVFGYALVDLAALSYLGLGVDQASPDWGLLVAAGQSDILAGHPQQSLYAAVLIVVAVAAVSVVGERITDREHDWRRR
jgi:peptide/nickel transport system permease protein